MNQFYVPGTKTVRSMEPLGYDIQTLRWQPQVLERIIQTLSLCKSDFQTKNIGPSDFGKGFFLPRQVWQLSTLESQHSQSLHILYNNKMPKKNKD